MLKDFQLLLMRLKIQVKKIMVSQVQMNIIKVENNIDIRINIIKNIFLSMPITSKKKLKNIAVGIVIRHK